MSLNHLPDSGSMVAQRKIIHDKTILLHFHSIDGLLFIYFVSKDSLQTRGHNRIFVTTIWPPFPEQIKHGGSIEVFVARKQICQLALMQSSINASTAKKAFIRSGAIIIPSQPNRL